MLPGECRLSRGGFCSGERGCFVASGISIKTKIPLEELPEGGYSGEGAKGLTKRPALAVYAYKT